MEEKVCFLIDCFHFTTFHIINQNFKVYIHHFRSKRSENARSNSPLFSIQIFSAALLQTKKQRAQEKKKQKERHKISPPKRHFCSYLLRFFMWNQGKNIIFHGKNVSFNCGKIFPFVFFTNEIFKNHQKRGINSPSKIKSFHILPFYKDSLKKQDFFAKLKTAVK